MNSLFTDIKAIDMKIRKILSNMGMMATGGPFQNKYKSDVIRKSRARNTQKKKSAETRQLYDYAYSDDEPIDIKDSIPIVLKHYLEELHAASVALPLLKSMRDTPEVLLATLHELAGGMCQRGDDESELEPSESWASLLSSASVLQRSPYKDLVDQLFMTPFTSYDSFQIQDVIAAKLSDDIRIFKNYILPYTKDSEHETLKRVSMEVDQVERFLETNTEYTSRFYDWKQVMMGLERVTEDAMHLNSVAEFEYNDKTLEEGVLEQLGGDAEDLGSYPDEVRFTPSNARRILDWRGSDLGYEEMLTTSSPAETLNSQHSVDGLFSTGTNYNLTLPIFKCKANVQMLDGMGPKLAYRCYDILQFNDFSEEADAYLAEFKNVLMSNLPDVCKIGVCPVRGVRGVNVIKLCMEFVGLGEVQDLYTYMTIPSRPAANSREPMRVIDVHLLSVLKQGAGMVRMLDESFFVEEVLDAFPDRVGISR